jgi:peptidoglycan/xylan/chitin deacetylase (PgdA/CDA1 family)
VVATQLVLRAHAEGHTIGSRGYGQLPYTGLTLAQVHDDVLISEMLIASIICSKAKTFRAPFNEITESQQVRRRRATRNINRCLHASCGLHPWACR